MDDKRVADYFVVAGLLDNASPLEEFSRDGNIPKTTHSLLPITDVTVIIRSQGEPVPKGYACIECTPLGFPADLNHGSLRSPNIFFCYRRGRDKPPLVDVGVLYEGKEKVMADSEVVLTTPGGHLANVNNSGSKTFITYRRAPENAPCNQLVVTDICIILANKGENPPHAFCKINKNLNKGVLGSDVYLCYKKSMNRPDILCYKPGILGRFPIEDYDNFALPPSVPLFCLPMGATIECWPKRAQQPKPVFSTFVLTSYSAEKVYGAAVTFYEPFPEQKLNETMKSHLHFSDEELKRHKCLQTNKSICLLSRWPFFDTFEKFLRYLHRMSVSGPHRVPLERIISHFMLEVPFPSVQRPRILIQLSDYTITLAQPGDTQLPLTGASFIQLLKNVGPDNCLKILLFALAEQKILFHSLRPDVLTSVAEAVVMLIFPFHWQCPYIPLCPLGLSDVLCAPVPFLVGVDSRYFDLFDPPQDVTCIDLDTNSIFSSEEKKCLTTKLFPKKPARDLRNTLMSLYGKLGSIKSSATQSLLLSNNSALIDYDFKTKKMERQLELEIQEAFLRFMACILKGYRQFLLPITTAPTIGTTDPNSLFDLSGFLKSRDKAYGRFYSMVMKTQMFIRFIEERSFVSDKDASLAFFDECTEKIDSFGSDMKFLEIDESQVSDRTVFVAPPEPIGLPPGLEYRYKQFGTLKPQLFHKNPVKSVLKLIAQASPMPNSPMARRSKQEIRSAQRIARKHSETPMLWAKCLVNYCFSLWFIHLPSYVRNSPSKSKALRNSFNVLAQVQKYKVCQPDEVCYRVLMLLCGLYSQPTLAVKILFEMKHYGVQPNAITYGYYNKAVLESKWPAADTSSTLMWNRLRNVIMSVAQFRLGLKNKARRSLSLCSETELDCLSRTSTESSNPDDVSIVRISNPAEFLPDLIKLKDDQNNSDESSDRGYSSMNHVDGIKSLSLHEPISVDNSKFEKEDKACCQEIKQAPKCTAARRLKFKEIDFTASDNFRCRVGSIVKSSATSIGSLSQFQDCSVDSSAGILMTSRTSLTEDMKFCELDTPVRRRHKSAGECNCSSLNYLLRSPNKPISDMPDEKTCKAPFLRSHSFGSDAQIIKKIRAGRDSHDSISKWIDSPLKMSVFDKKRDEKDRISKNCALTRCDEEPEAEQQEMSPVHTPRHKSSDVLIEKQRKISVESKKSSVSNLSSEEGSMSSAAEDKNLSEEAESNISQDFLSSTFSPLKEAWLNWDISGSAKDVASNITTTFGNVYRESFRRKAGNKVSRSSTFHSGARNSIPKLKQRKESVPAVMVNSDGRSMSRSSTLPMTPRIDNASDTDLTDSPASLPLSSSSFGISKLNSRHSEVLFEGLKSAVTSVSSKLNDLRTSLSASNTPTKNVTPLSSQQDIDLIIYDDNDSGGLMSDGYRISMDYSGFSDVSDSPISNLLGRDRTPVKSDWHGTLHHVGSAPVFSSQVYEMFEKQNSSPNDNQTNQRVALEIVMTTCSRCHHCSSLLYDEEIMEGWSADDSNLNTRCTFCKAKLVPLLSIFIQDMRWEENSMSTAQSSESVCSVSSNIRPDVFGSDSLINRPQENNMSVKSNIDSNHNAFILIEENSDNKDFLKKSQYDRNIVDSFDPLKTEISVPSSLDENENPSIAVPPFNARLRKLSQSTNSSTSDVRRFSVSLNDIEPVTVPYLSPLVLRKEVENVLEHEGDNCMTKPEFVDQHPIIYWNLVWFFKRIGVQSHLLALVLCSDSTTKGKKIPESCQKMDERNVSVHCVWDNVKLHDETGQPLYMLWTQLETGEQSSLVTALLTDEWKASRNAIKQILARLQCNDLYSPICMLINERKKSPARKHHHSIYREILFLLIVAIGRENIDNLSFDLEYRKAYSQLSNKQLSQLHTNDRPPTDGAVFCRRLFRDLELKMR